MSEDCTADKWRARRPWLLQLALAGLGVVVNSIYNGSWHSVYTLVYDLPASLVTFGFIAQVVVEWSMNGMSRYLLYRLVTVLVLFAVTAGRQYLQWTISGHLSCALAVAIIQCLDVRLPRAERVFYWMPFCVALFLRWFSEDYYTVEGVVNHWQTYNAIFFAVACALPAFAFRGQRVLREQRNA